MARGQASGKPLTHKSERRKPWQESVRGEREDSNYGYRFLHYTALGFGKIVMLGKS